MAKSLKYPHLDLRGNVWWINVRNRMYGDVRESTGTSDEDRAYLICQARLGEIAASRMAGSGNTAPARTGSTMSLLEGFQKAYREHWMLNCKASTLATVAHDWKAVARLFPKPVHHVQLHEITTAMLTEFRIRLHGDGLSVNSVKHKLAVVSTILNLAVEQWHILELLPKFPSIPKPRSKKLPMQEKDYEAACSYLGKGLGVHDLDVRDVLTVAWLTGARMSEILNLTDHDIDLKLKAVRFYDTKNDPRSIPVDDEVMGILRGRMGTKRGKPFGDINKDTVGHTFARLRTALKLDARVTFHSTRHAAITRMFDMNLPTAKVQAYVGHRQAETTAGYTHLATAGLADCAKALKR